MLKHALSGKQKGNVPALKTAIQNEIHGMLKLIN